MKTGVRRALRTVIPLVTQVMKYWRAKQSRDGYSFKVPVGAEVEVVRNFPRKRVLVRYHGELILTYQGCLSKGK